MQRERLPTLPSILATTPLDRCTELLHTLLVSLNNKDNRSLVTIALCQQLEGGGEAAPLVLRPYLYPEAGTHSGTRYMGGSLLGIGPVH